MKKIYNPYLKKSVSKDYIDFINPLINENNLTMLSRTSVPILMCKESEVVSFRSKYGSYYIFEIILKGKT